jgi:hypothetical protein
MWRFTVEGCRDVPAVVSYNLMAEPHPNTLVDPDGELEPREVQARLEGTLMNWRDLAAEITTAVREAASSTPMETEESSRKVPHPRQRLGMHYYKR